MPPTPVVPALDEGEDGDPGLGLGAEAAAAKLRATGSGAAGSPGSRRVVPTPLRRLTPAKPATRISRATRLRPTRHPSARSSACTRGAP
jgi:hypothetical protein